jgi:HD-like signal output (HDOD) protein
LGFEHEVAFSAGLLHDIGKLIICCFMPEEHKLVREYVEKHKCTDFQAEMEIVGYSHSLVGKILGESWKLPEIICHAVAEHHEPDIDARPEHKYSVLVHIANYLAKRTFSPDQLKNDEDASLLPEVAEQFRLDEEKVEEMCSSLLDLYSKSSTFMQMAMCA